MTRHKGKIWYQLASEQDREIYICTDENSNSQSQSKKKKNEDFSFEYYFFLCTSGLCTSGENSLHHSQVS